ncbi:UbiD family decarboxylase [Natrialba asiatica]|uniref:3-octaprenyl-4-hydroxybenzoate carboxy-lyase-like C-terminal domain-containing protein n=1 Tax=Natrialba asiatica (strain ATCC 700177 / DSM 12278 / JCM 9576 / FERM P-10747 / NBRC 102637 / 172P1) TaxID=29540 RepID=M0AKK5_NATA1|nr:UbiD family decarboxylase domain-containing protein [Natrialba asiatica]ELY98452.1 hypothetical protein C481_17522 [Natrialba asiatica DSM 12278]
MTAFRNHLEFLRRTDDCCALDRPDGLSPQVVAAEALRADGPAIELTTDGRAGVELASGVYGGIDQTRGRTRGQPRGRYPWTRLGLGLGVDRDPAYVDVLETLLALGERRAERDVTYVERAAAATELGVRELGLPTPPDEAWPRFTLGVLSIGADAGSYWAPIHGTILDGRTIRARVPEAIAAHDRLSTGASATIALGVPSEALAAAHLLAITDRLATPIEDRGVGATVPLIPTAGGVVPSSAEVVIETAVADRQPDTRSEKREFWEHLVPSTTLTLEAEAVFSREDPVVPYAPLGAALSDDLQLAALSLSATLCDRVNSYWGVSPVDWLLLPAEGRLGLCLVASEILYAGFEWQLANLLFSLSDCFDKVIVVDTETGPRNLGQVLGDSWVKAHPSRDWLFSEADAPAARLPAYGRDDETGARLYVDATWDPRWKDEFIAPRVSITDSYPPEIRAAVRDSWAELGFESDAAFEEASGSGS